MGTYQWSVQHKGEFSGWSEESDLASFSAIAPPDHLYSCGSDDTVRKLDPSDMTEVAQFTGHSG
ncbi:MAG: hypothetical protein ACLFRS_04235, partial [Halomonas sp.]